MVSRGGQLFARAGFAVRIYDIDAGMLHTSLGALRSQVGKAGVSGCINGAR